MNGFFLYHPLKRDLFLFRKIQLPLRTPYVRKIINLKEKNYHTYYRMYYECIDFISGTDMHGAYFLA